MSRPGAHLAQRFDQVYPERDDRLAGSALDRIGAALGGAWSRFLASRPKRVRAIAGAVTSFVPAMEALADDALAPRARELALQLRRRGLEDALVAETFALVREAAGRTLGMRHFDVQLIGGWVMLNGMVAEMETGEGKTLTATLPACTAALAGRTVHVITVNDYLVARDHALMAPVYAALGISSAAVTAEMSPDERRAAYACDVVYCSNKTVVFDYLRDRIVLGSQADTLHLRLDALYGGANRSSRLLLRGLGFAIVDEADSVLADEAGTPLIISGEVPSAGRAAEAQQAIALARQLDEGEHYRVLRGERVVELTQAGHARAADLARVLGAPWDVALRRDELVSQALTALHLFVCDEHYLVRDGKIQVIDAFTGRVMADRSWGQGLHQMIEVKEGCEVTARRETLARISYQRFFRRYRHLSGMSGTAREVAAELGSVYGLAVVPVPTHQPNLRRHLPDRVFATADEKWEAVLNTVLAHHARGAPVLVGNRSVAASERLGAMLAARGIEHAILNARQDSAEAQVVAAAGQPGRITIATNMAGRGTDIKLAAAAAAAGGLHVILTERHEAGRIDRQIAGRSARQGDPGHVEALLSLEDEVLATPGLSWAGLALRLRASEAARARAIVAAQRRGERLASARRRAMLQADRQTGDLLAFSGRAE